jgi:serine/threonine protein kinase
MIADEQNRLPRRFDAYVLVRVLAEGGMGQVYLALAGTRDVNKLCVIKRVRDVAVDAPVRLPEVQARFRREAEIAMALSHGTIAQTFDAGDNHGLYLVQEFVQGMSLRSLMSAMSSASAVMPVDVASHIVLRVAGALAYLHDFQGRGLVHRDVTPENVMLAYSGEVKLIDFGVAKSTASVDGLTQSGAWFGKPSWIAPELFFGRRLDRRVDLYALGLLTWCLLSGKNRPFTAPLEPSQGSEIVPSPSTFNARVSPDLDRIVAKAIHCDPDFRFQTAEAFQQAVESVIPAGPISTSERSLAALLAKHTSPDQESVLDSVTEEARQLLGPPKSTANWPAKARRLQRGRRWTITVATVAGCLLSLALLFLVGNRRLPSASIQAIATSMAAPSPQAGVTPRCAEPNSTASAPPPPPALAPIAAASVAIADAEPRAHLGRKPFGPRSVRAEPIPPSSSPSERLFNSAMDDFERSQLVPALDLAERSASQGAGAKAYILIGRIRALRQDFVGARASFEEALRLSPENKEIERRLERLRTVKQGGRL